MDFKRRLMEKVKRNRYLIKIYRNCGNVAIMFLKLFVKPDSKLILFNSFGGKKFDDSPKAIYNVMKNDPRFASYKLVWAFHKPEDYPYVQKRVKTDGLQYFIYALKARCWISNSSIQRGLVFKGKNTFSFNTWHGTPLKDMSLPDGRVNRVMDECDAILAQSNFEMEAFVKCWNISKDKYRIFGLPRNDELANSDEKDKQRIRKKLGIPDSKLVILYAPTFRDYLLDDKDTCMLDIPFDYEYWEKTFGNIAYFMMRVHYEVAKHNQLPTTPMWHDYSDYDSVNDLMIAADILVSDYSSIMFDYSILGRPIINYIYDYDEYNQKRGMLFDIREWLPWVKDSRELADTINSLEYDANIDKVVKFRNKFVEVYGNAANESVDYIFEKINGSNMVVKKYG